MSDPIAQSKQDECCDQAKALAQQALNGIQIAPGGDEPLDVGERAFANSVHQGRASHAAVGVLDLAVRTLQRLSPGFERTVPHDEFHRRPNPVIGLLRCEPVLECERETSALLPVERTLGPGVQAQHECLVPVGLRGVEIAHTHCVEQRLVQHRMLVRAAAPPDTFHGAVVQRERLCLAPLQAGESRGEPVVNRLVDLLPLRRLLADQLGEACAKGVR